MYKTYLINFIPIKPSQDILKMQKQKIFLDILSFFFVFFILRERAKYSELKISRSNPFEHWFIYCSAQLLARMMNHGMNCINRLVIATINVVFFYLWTNFQFHKTDNHFRIIQFYSSTNLYYIGSILMCWLTSAVIVCYFHFSIVTI